MARSDMAGIDAAAAGVTAALEHYDACRALCGDALRVCGADSDEARRAATAKGLALLMLDLALAARHAVATNMATAGAAEAGPLPDIGGAADREG